MDNQRPPAEVEIDTKSLTNQLVNVSSVSLNVSQKLIITTEDKVRLCLSEHLRHMEKKHGWIAPLGILVAIVLTFVTATFRKMGLSAATWQAVFIIAGGLVLVWLAYSILEARKAEAVQDIVERIKKDSRSKT